MLLKPLSLACSFIALISASALALQFPPQDKPILVKGTTETAAGCPVALADARYTFIGQPGQELKKVKPEVKIQNISGQAIRKAIIAFRHNDKYGIGRTHEASKPIPIGETETHISNFSIQYPEGTDKADIVDNSLFTAFVLAAEFEDGSHWVKPRTSDTPLSFQSLGRQEAPLSVRDCSDIDKSYRAKLRLNVEGVIAYRLGVVKDTPDAFEVRVGDWVELPESFKGRGSERVIRATDDVVSLPQHLIFMREKYAINFRFSRPGSIQAGGALFIAEARLPDGTIWKQKLTREDLIWNEVSH
jgi:hypothetical protein